MARANSQGLSPTALRAKRARDLAAAKTPLRRARKAENQRIGQSPNSDIHHVGGQVGRTEKTGTTWNRANYDK